MAQTPRSVVPIRVRYHETDQMGIAHHSNYPRWFEVGRIDLLERAGVSYRSLEEGGHFLPVIELGVKYLRPARFDDVVRVETVFLEVLPSRIVFGSLLTHDAEGDVVARAYSVHAMTDRSGRAVFVPEPLVERLEPLCSPEPFFTRKRKAFRY